MLGDWNDSLQDYGVSLGSWGRGFRNKTAMRVREGRQSWKDLLDSTPHTHRPPAAYTSTHVDLTVGAKDGIESLADILPTLLNNTVPS